MKTQRQVAKNMLPPRRSVPRSFSVTIDNSAEGAVTSYSLLDFFGFVGADATGVADRISTDNPGGIEGLKKMLASNPLVVSKLTYQVDSVAQFARAFKFSVGDFDGTVTTKNLTSLINRSQNNFAQNDKLIHLEFKTILDGFCDLVIAVGAGEKVVLTFTVEDAQRLV